MHRYGHASQPTGELSSSSSEEHGYAGPEIQIPTAPPKRRPWNKGKLIGPKPPLRPKHVWSIRTKLQIGGRTRDLAMFNLAIDSKLRGCDADRRIDAIDLERSLLAARGATSKADIACC
jgi:hypothetical protein